MRELLTLMVERLGGEPLEVGKAKDAMDHLEHGRADAMLLDLQMPRANGIDLLRAMRRRRLWVPTVVVSAFISNEAAEQLTNLGVSGMVANPFDKERMLEEIQKIIRLGGGVAA